MFTLMIALWQGCYTFNEKFMARELNLWGKKRL